MYTAFLVLAIIALGIQSLLLFLAFFGPDYPYRVKEAPAAPIDSPEFRDLLACLSDAQVHTGNQIEVLTDGHRFYEAELAAIAQAQKSVNLEAFIFYKGEIGRRFVDALAERARSGVKVKLIVDFLGSLRTSSRYFRPITKAGGRLKWYHTPRLDLLPQINNRTHRELLVIDGETAFIGGAGVADQWYHGTGGNPAWRDTVCRVQGPAVSGLQSVFAENWLRVAGEILTGGEYFAFPGERGGSTGLVVNSTPGGRVHSRAHSFPTLDRLRPKERLHNYALFSPRPQRRPGRHASHS